MKTKPILLAFITCLLTILVMASQPATAESLNAPPPPTNPELEDQNQVEAAIRRAMAEQAVTAPVYLLTDTQVDNIHLSQDRSWATAWLIMRDAQSGDVLPTEPGLVLAQRVDSGWQVTLPTDSSWRSLLLDFPQDLAPEDTKTEWLLQSDKQQQSVPSAPLHGYLLPWEGGKTVFLSQSVGHDQWRSDYDAHYAYDFYVYKAMFNVYAAKAGRVKTFRDTCNNDDHSCVHWMVLEDTSTSPTTYQLYLHFAHDSIPPALKTIGIPVVQGQFLGVADNTGQSTGHHLHFQVQTNLLTYWGKSVDIVFEDVGINGGRPRVQKYDQPYCLSDDVCSAFSDWYVSGNRMAGDRTAPRGGISDPLNGINVMSSTLQLKGWAIDDFSGLGSAQFIANYDGTWRPIGGAYLPAVQISNEFTTTWDLCKDGIPNGPVSLALDLRDKVGNQTPGLPGLLHFSNNVACPQPQPTCNPTQDQIAIFAEPDYNGACQLFGSGSYTTTASLGAVGNDNLSSIIVGTNLLATLYMENNLKGRGETFSAEDSNLSDNWIGAKTVSSIQVKSRNTTPALPIPIWPENNQAFPNASSLSLSWDNGGGDSQYQAVLKIGTTQTITSTWQTAPVWNLGSLTAGTYKWQVRAKNGYSQSAWTTARSFQIQAPAQAVETSHALELTLVAPFTDTLENEITGWSNSNNWDLSNSENHTPGGSVSWAYDTSSTVGYDTGTPNYGDLTSPPVKLPNDGVYALRFWYKYETEGSNEHWDQRWVQISVDNGPFSNIQQLFDDPPNYWLRSQPISLAAYAGHTIRVRFHFETLDRANNGYQGWMIDDFSILNAQPIPCSDTADNDTWIKASPLDYGEFREAEICPEGDVDYYRFTGSSGDQIGVLVEAQNIGSSLDSYLALLDNDGQSLLAENDDQVATVRKDSLITYRLKRAGTYYLKVRAWDHPAAGGNDFPYILHLYNDSQKPSLVFAFPTPASLLPVAPISLTVSTNDLAPGISHVQFLWHSADWLTTGWKILGEDWNGQDGWAYSFDASGLPPFSEFAFYARAYDWAGNEAGAGIWNLQTRLRLFLPTVQR